MTTETKAKSTGNNNNNRSSSTSKTNLPQDDDAKKTYSDLADRLFHELYNYKTPAFKDSVNPECLYQAHARYYTKILFQKPTPGFEIDKSHLSHELRKELVDFKILYESGEFGNLLREAVGKLFENNNSLQYVTQVKPLLWVKIDDSYMDQEKFDDDILLGDYRDFGYNSETDKDRTLTLFSPDIDYVTESLKEHFVKDPDGITEGLTKFMFSEKINAASIEKILSKLCNLTNNAESEEFRLKTVRNIFLKASRREISDTDAELLVKKLTPLMDDPQDFLNNIAKIWRRYNSRIFKDISNEILVQLGGHTFELISEKPKSFVVARSDTKQITQAVIEIPKIKGADPDVEIDPRLYFKDVIINAIPTKIIRYEDPSAHNDIKYEIEFETNLGKKYKTDPLPLDEIADFLKDIGLVYKTRVVDETLAQILQAYDRDGKVQVTHDIDATGLYLVNGKIECFGFTFNQPVKEEMKESCKLMTKLVVTTYGSDERLPTLLKWFINAPFNYIRKSYKTWMVFPHLNGIASTTKSTRCDIGMAIWRIDFTHDDPINPQYNIPFTSIDTKPKLGKVVSRTTFPILISEVGSLSDENHYGALAEMIKNCAELLTARAAHDRKGHYRTYPARSALALTGNPPPPIEGGYASRILDMIFTTKDQHIRGSKEAEEFQAWLTPELDKMGVLGDFTYYYVREHQDILKKSWKDAGKEILKEFYKAADEKVPEWINLTLDIKPLQDATDRTRLLIRQYFMDLINDTHSHHLRTRDNIQTGIVEKLKECCNNNFIAFIQYDERKQKFYITQNIMDDLKRKRNLDGLVGNLEGLAHMMGFKCQTNRVLGTSMHSISVDVVLMRDLLTSKVSEELEVQTKIDETTPQTNVELNEKESVVDCYYDEFLKEYIPVV